MIIFSQCHIFVNSNRLYEARPEKAAMYLLASQTITTSSLHDHLVAIASIYLLFLLTSKSFVDMSSAVLTQDSTIDNTIGCFFILGFLTAPLWGAGTLQFYFYCDKYWTTDKWRLKLYVLTVWVLDTGLQITIVHTLYMQLVKGYANFAYLIHFNKVLPQIVIITAFINVLVQVLFVMRIWNWSKHNNILTCSVAALVIVQFTITIVYAAMIYQFMEYSQLSTVFGIQRSADIVIALTDTVISGVLVFVLHSRRSGFRATDSSINRLIFYTVCTGILTALCAIIALITSLALPHTLYYLLFNGLCPEFYVNSMLALLNSRQKIRDGLMDNTEGGLIIRMSRLRTRYADTAKNPRNIATVEQHMIVDIKVDTETVFHSDGHKDLAKAPSESESDIEAVHVT